MKSIFYTLLTYYSLFTIIMIMITFIKGRMLKDIDNEFVPHFFFKKRIECLLATIIALTFFYVLVIKLDQVLPQKIISLKEISSLTFYSAGFTLASLYLAFVSLSVIFSTRKHISKALALYEEELEEELKEPQLQ